jgi:predicted GNAT family N-acyltransferase/ubiquinone/menaquinone biosynthesis C-methylase UbiE
MPRFWRRVAHGAAAEAGGAAMAPVERRHTDILREEVAIGGQRILDVGCGDGTLVRWLAAKGAEAVGVECSPGRLAAFGLATEENGVRFAGGVGEALPFADASFDTVVFFNSLHHVAPKLQGVALSEAARVLVEGGTLYVAEPLAEGSHFELLRPVDDETGIRAAACDAIRSVTPDLLRPFTERFYTTVRRYTGFEAMRDSRVKVSPARAQAFEANEAKLRRDFDRLARADGDNFAFEQPMRVNLLRKPRKPARTAAPTIEIVEAGAPAERDLAFAIRREVFVEEQKVPLELEFDPIDEEARHLLATIDGSAAGTLRWRMIGPGEAKIERVAVRQAERGAGVAAAMIRHVLERLAAGGVRRVTLHAQTYARTLYARLGFRVVGDVFDEDGLPHVAMVHELAGHVSLEG